MFREETEPKAKLKRLKPKEEQWEAEGTLSFTEGTLTEHLLCARLCVGAERRDGLPVERAAAGGTERPGKHLSPEKGITEIGTGCWEREMSHLEVGGEKGRPGSFHRKGERRSECYKIRKNICSAVGRG